MYKLKKENISGISPIIIENAEKDNMLLNIEGDSYQSTREGYNLANYNTSADSSTLNFQIGNITTGKTYTLYLYIPTGTTSFNLRYNTVGGTTILTDYNRTGEVIKTFTAVEDAILYFNGFIPSEDYAGIEEIMLLEGTYTTENLPTFEEYGASPSLDYPSEVEAVGDNINLFNDELEVGAITGGSGDNIDDTTRIRTKNFIELEAGTYTLSFKGVEQCGGFLYDLDETFKETLFTWQQEPYTFTIVTKSKLKFTFKNENSNSITPENINEIKLEKGTAATAYSLPGQGSVEIVKSNANLFEETSNLEGVKTSYTNIVKGNFVLQPDTYYTVTCDTNNNGGKLYLNEHIFATSNRMNCDGKRHAITAKIKNTYTSNYKNETLLKTDGAVDISYKISNVQIAINNKIEFIEHKGNTYNLPIQKPFLKGDYFIKEDNHWKEVHLREKRNIKDDIQNAVLSGTNNFIYVSNLLLNIAQPITNEVDANILSNVLNHATYNEMHAGSVDYGIGISQVGSLIIRINGLTTLEEYKNALNNDNYYYYFYLATPERIDCTEEQSNILDNLQTYDGQNIITIDTFNNTNPNILIDYTPKMTDEIKQAFTKNITKAYVIRTRDGFEINQDNYLKDYKLEELRFVPDNGFIGGTVARRLTLDFNNVDNQFDIQDEDLRFFAGVEYEGKDYYIDYGNFIVQKPETENTTDNTNATCLDYMCLLNATYNDEMTYPCTLEELAENVCSQAGLELATKTFRNSDFIVTDNQFVNNEPLRTVLGAIALSAFSWARIGQDNRVYIDFTIKQQEDISLDYDSYFNLSMASKPFGPINRIIMRNSQVEGENITVQDDESIAQNGVHELVIADNPFAYTQKKRQQLIEAGKVFYGFTYMPVNSMDTIGYAFLDSNSLIKFKDMQGKDNFAYVLNHTIDYAGTLLDSIEGPAMTETETKYTYTPEHIQRLKRTEIIVDKHEQQISSIIQEQDELTNRQNVLEQNLDSTTNTISEVNEDLTERINQLQVNLDGLSQTVSQKGGDNIFSYDKEFWTGDTDDDVSNLEEYTDTDIQQNSVSGVGYIINKGTSRQNVQVKNDTYTISFTYKKLVELATGYVLINGTRYDLTSINWDEIVVTLDVNTNYVDFEIISDTNNAFEIFDLMGSIGNEKQVWTQNANETRTDTVKIGKGITVSSSLTNTIWKADADGNRIINTDTGETVAEFTDKGTVTKNIEVQETAEIAGILIQEIDNQTWISSLL